MLKVISSLIVLISFIGCTDNSDKETINNTFYIEVVNTADSIKKAIENGLVGKTSFRQQSELKIVSKEYMTEHTPDMHYYNSVVNLDKKIKEGSVKIIIDLQNNYVKDTVIFSMPKYKYSNNEWKKISDLGIITTPVSSRNLIKYRLGLKEYVQTLITQVAAATY
ncbi:MAG: hypothetical protein IPP48_09595 [Chitinophagaceae bacterium]|nr:hypothetical protein [Chitinophagaceae bacterium]